MSTIRPQDEEREWLGSVGARVGILRRRLGLDATVLAERAGIHRNTVDRVESGAVNCSAVLLRRIADALGTELESLFTKSPCMVQSSRETLELPEKPGRVVRG